MPPINIQLLYLGRQFTQTDANNSVNTNYRVILYDNYPRFFARGYDSKGSGDDIWYEIHLYRRTGAAPPFTYTELTDFNVNSIDDSEYFYGKQFYKSGEECCCNFSLVADSSVDLDAYTGLSSIFGIQWVAYDAATFTPLASNIVEFTYIPESRLLQLEKIDFVSFDRMTIYRPDNNFPPNWIEVEAPLVPLSVDFDEPFESAPKSISVTMTDPDGLFLPNSDDNINYIGTSATGVYSPVFRLGNKVAYEHSLAYGAALLAGWATMITYTDPSRYRGRVYVVDDPALRKTPLVMQTIQVRRSFDGLPPANPLKVWEIVTAGDEFEFFQYGIFFRDDQLVLGVTDVECAGSYYQCQWDYAGLFYMGAPTYSNNPGTGNILKVDCQDRLSLLDKNGDITFATCEIQRFAQKREVREQTTYIIPGGLPYNDEHLKTWQDPNLPLGLLLYFYDLNGPYAGNYVPTNPGDTPISDGSAAVWDDEFEVLVEWDESGAFPDGFTHPPLPPDPGWYVMDEDAYDRTPYGILFNRDWSSINPTPAPWVDENIRITFQYFVPDTNPVKEIIRDIMEYPNFEETVGSVPGRYGGFGAGAADYDIPGITSTISPSDPWMDLDVNRFVWSHFNGTAFDAIKEVMRIAGFPYNYRVTAEPNPLWNPANIPIANPPEDIITFREVSQLLPQDVEFMLMMSVDVQQKIEEDRVATLLRSRIFDDFTLNFNQDDHTYCRILWGPTGPDVPPGLAYEGGFNHGEELGQVYLQVWHGNDGPGNDPFADISSYWRPGLVENTGYDVAADNDAMTHIRWANASNQWGKWHDFIATPIMEIIVNGTYDRFNLAALDFRNSLQIDVTTTLSDASHEQIGIKYGVYGDMIVVGGLTVSGINTLSGVVPGTFTDDELIGATLEIFDTGAVGNPDRGNTYPIIGNSGVAGTIDVEIRDPYFVLNTMQAQLVGALPGRVSCYIKRYKWLPNFNRKIVPHQETVEWENTDYSIKHLRAIEIWCIKPAVTNIWGAGGAEYNDQFIDIGEVYMYDEGANTGRPALARIRDEALEVESESEDASMGFPANSFYRPDLINRLGMRTHIIPDDKNLNTDNKGFERCTEALYENLVIEDSYEIDGIYYPLLPRYSTVLINIQSMRIALPALIESRSFSFSGAERKYKYVLRNYNNAVWPHFDYLDYGDTGFDPGPPDEGLGH